MRGYLNQAIYQAQSEGKSNVVAGLQNVIDEAKYESRMLAALEVILQNKGENVPLEHFKIFKHHVKKGMRRWPNTFDQSSGTSASALPVQPQTVGYIATWSTKNPSSVHDPASINNNAQNASLNSHNARMEHSIYNSPPKFRQDSPSILDVPAADFATTDIAIHADQPSFDDPPVATIPSRRRSSDASTTSTLSTAISIAQPPSPSMPGLSGESGGRATRSSAVQRQDPSQVASSSETRLLGADLSQQPSVPPRYSYQDINITNQPATKKIKLTHPLSDDEIKEVDEQRKFFESQTVRDYNYNPPTSVQFSELRPELDESQAFPQPTIREGPPPPVIHPNPLIEVSSPTSQGDFAAINGTGRKRGYDEVIADDQSSLSDAISVSLPVAPTNVRHSVGASSTRASTPRAAREPRSSKQRHPRVMIS